MPRFINKLDRAAFFEEGFVSRDRRAMREKLEKQPGVRRGFHVMEILLSK
jgi:hypothetical protein